ncbi:dipeptide/oligopeptide/nickel ABC transporter permease/ATP-binding protein [Microlunatus soli]|uniref:Oligopeptide/dipeptide ABC transporter, ATP-binding protein, C-terminal domain-containing protein n=1 Tax=Microlunatus soli TaxID=630515 RepID=A0A1H1T9B5_9ACTN|nr:dipeptide/oligopeptide/nickel ABC transporter permease/ATP-binding protein [Microlunatus soli]SDS56199.1 oligopeptide/dipeptide ABC transporter, ATP-binding protein, C-terminal domain-containing protein [Microlunatus soli]
MISRQAGGRSRWTVGAVVPLVLIGWFAFLAIAGPAIWGATAERTDPLHAGLGMSLDHPMGTDDLGRDVLARTLVAIRRSLVLAVLSTVIGGCVGVALGLVAGMADRIGRIVGALITTLIAFPALLLAIFFAVLFGIGTTGSVLAVGAAFAPGFARLSQTLSASVSTREYVQAARMLGKSPVSIVLRHVLPNIGEPLILYTTIHIGTAILSLSGLSFLGLGVQPPSYDWGRMLSEGLTRVYVSPGSALAPAIAIVLAGITFNLAGEQLSDVLGGREAAARTVTAEAAELVPGAEDVDHDQPSVLQVRGLRVVYGGRDRVATPVRDVSFSVTQGQTVAIVGESGSGKSMATSAVARLVEQPGSVAARELRLAESDLLGPDAERVLGQNLAMIFQDPGEALNPAIKIGTHLIEPAVVHRKESRATARAKALEVLRSVAIPDPERRYGQHQHELSGGMKQRICIAIALMGEPRLLIADEPTTALDVTVQRQILRLIAQAGEQTGASILFISHDIAVVSEISDRIVVMYAGFVVEDAPTPDLLSAPAHPYTAMLMAASPDMTADLDQPLPTLDGTMPRADEDLPGCYFANRCPRADETCRTSRPPLTTAGDTDRRVACWHPLTAGDALISNTREQVAS